jgi:Zn-dependent peptidase ImmA (M78 family)
MNGLYGTVINAYFSKIISKKELVEISKKNIKLVQFWQPLIFINFSEMKKLSKKRKMNIVAHEIAHFILNHHLKNCSKMKDGMRLEKEADDLIVKWGFKREYKSYK